MAVQIVVQIAMQWHNCLSLSHSFVHIPTAHTHTQIYSLFLTAAAGHLTEGLSHAGAWANAVHAGIQAMMRYQTS